LQQLSYLTITRTEDSVPKATGIRSVDSLLLVIECTEIPNGNAGLRSLAATGLATDRVFVYGALHSFFFKRLRDPQHGMPRAEWTCTRLLKKRTVAVITLRMVMDT
jgi:hypothetical protein